jgi:hypothetical protein
VLPPLRALQRLLDVPPLTPELLADDRHIDDGAGEQRPQRVDPSPRCDSCPIASGNVVSRLFETSSN